MLARSSLTAGNFSFKGNFPQVWTGDVGRGLFKGRALFVAEPGEPQTISTEEAVLLVWDLNYEGSQGTVLSLMLFNIYVNPLNEIA